MSQFTLHDLQCFDAVIREGGFQAAAAVLHRSHPAVFAAVAKLERQLGLKLLDREGYRVRPTEAGLSLQRRAQSLLREMETLRVHAKQLLLGEETQLRVVIGDLCPRPQSLGLLSAFFTKRPATRLHVDYEAITGPWERLFDDEADLILHRIDKSDPRLEWIDLGTVSVVPVVAPKFLPFPITSSISPEMMREFTQCIIRDTARHSPERSYFVVEGAHQCSVADHQMKKELILHGMAWGHVPRFLIEEELRDGRLLSIVGRHFPGVTEELVAARRRDRPQGPVANQLWEYLEAQAANLRSVLASASARRVKAALTRRPKRKQSQRRA
ncbi:LysR family transcriptional regulator [Steroidobacter agaridevorans]|uniref:LysR family transcriptional regulator n=1 Tax=Steroidobacter agaridevorans TaxID=2695856 RepID=A0A829Y8B1_9GAMM|nr:LysR family transcriptional regulator [Steroidobacter agaridevorans]GFE79273.1 LysR family transcriptional regulator [Steroidobacter agaridevorans]